MQQDTRILHTRVSLILPTTCKGWKVKSPNWYFVVLVLLSKTSTHEIPVHTNYTNMQLSSSFPPITHWHLHSRRVSTAVAVHLTTGFVDVFCPPFVFPHRKSWYILVLVLTKDDEHTTYARLCSAASTRDSISAKNFSRWNEKCIPCRFSLGYIPVCPGARSYWQTSPQNKPVRTLPAYSWSWSLPVQTSSSRALSAGLLRLPSSCLRTMQFLVFSGARARYLTSTQEIPGTASPTPRHVSFEFSAFSILGVRRSNSKFLAGFSLVLREGTKRKSFPRFPRPACLWKITVDFFPHVSSFYGKCCEASQQKLQKRACIPLLIVK